MKSDDIDIWVDSLNGKVQQPASDAIKKEVTLFHELFEAQRVQGLLPEADQDLLSNDIPVDQHLRDKILFRLKREGLLEAKTNPIWKQFALAASVAFIGLFGFKYYQITNAPGDDVIGSMTAIRGDSELQKIQVDKPDEVSLALASKLKDIGLVVRRVPEGSGWRLQAKAEANNREAVLEILKAYAVNLPDHGRIDVIFTTK